jgi:hypothetical protein
MRARDAFDAGYTRHEVDRLLEAPFWGIRSEDRDFSTGARCHQLLPRLPEGAFYSHATAALLWSLGLPPWLEHDTRLHVSVPKGRRAVDAAQIVGHQVAVGSDAVTSVDGLPVSAPARVWRELGSALALADLVALGDELLRRDRALCSLEQLREGTRTPGIRGRRNLLAALPLLNGRAESRPESLMRVALVRAALPRLLVNEDLLASDGTFLARPDLRFADYPVAVEYDGDGHRTDARQWRRDVSRFARMADAGVDVVRATADDLPTFNNLILRTRSRLRKHGWSR